MDDIIVRTRYPRHSTSVRRKKRNVKDNGRLIQVIIRQVILSILILAIVAAIKGINTPVTNYLTDKIKGVLFQNIELGNIYSNIDNTLDKVLKSKVLNKENDITDDAAPASADVNNNSSGNTNNGSYDISGTTLEQSIVDEINKKYTFTIPVSGPLGSPFGNRISPIKQTAELHKGIDIEADKGASIKAVLGGEVIEAATEPTYGNYIKIKHSDGIETIYAHCSVLAAKKGQKVKQGEIIAMVGDTGASVGTHLHFEIWKDGMALNPTDFINVPSKQQTANM